MKPLKTNPDAFLEEAKARQQNTLWPDAMKNSSGVDAFLWKGSPNPPMVQRIGAWVFGLFFISMAFCILDIAFEHDSPRESLFEGAFSILWFLLGIKVFSNGFPKRQRNETTPPNSGSKGF